MAVQHLSDHAVIDQLLGMMYAVEEVHNMPCHEYHMILFTCLHHGIAVLVAERDGLFTEDILSMLRRLDDRFLVQIVGRRDDDTGDVLPFHQLIQAFCFVTAQLLCDFCSVVRIIHHGHLRILLLIHDPRQIRAEISCSCQTIFYHFIILLF